MRVIMDDKVYDMDRKQKKQFLNVAKNLIPKGIYAIEKDGIAEMKNEVYDTDKELSNAIAEYVRKGFKVHFNGGNWLTEQAILKEIVGKAAVMAKEIHRGRDVEIKTSNGGLKILSVDKKTIR